MSKEKELKELTNLIFSNGCVFYGHIPKCYHKTAKIIQKMGYTKSHFPIEKLEEWLRELKENWSKRKNKDKIEESLADMIVVALQGVFDKIQELKGDIEEEG